MALVEALCVKLPAPRRLGLRPLHAADGRLIDRGLVAIFPAPHSFTGEDCAELQVHGSQSVVDALLRELTRQTDVRLAQPGEFTRQAFENGRLDLTEVEGLGDLIAAQTEGQRRQALRRAEGGLSVQIASWREAILQLRAEIEAHLDFSDEDDVPDQLSETFFSDLSHLQATLQTALAGYDGGRIVREGFRVVLAGPPNAGKSSLLNALTSSDVAIVSPEAGTTRDVREVQIDLNGQLVLFYDVAGLRETESLAEAEGVRRARQAMGDADLVVWLQPADMVQPSGPDPNDLQWAPDFPEVMRVHSKADLLARSVDGLAVSVKQEGSVQTLLRLVEERACAHIREDAPLISHLRDREAIAQALDEVRRAQNASRALEMRAEDLRLAGAALAHLTGHMGAEAVLDRLFAGFCIGK